MMVPQRKGVHLISELLVCLIGDFWSETSRMMDLGGIARSGIVMQVG